MYVSSPYCTLQCHSVLHEWACWPVHCESCHHGQRKCPQTPHVSLVAPPQYPLMSGVKWRVYVGTCVNVHCVFVHVHVNKILSSYNSYWLKLHTCMSVHYQTSSLVLLYDYHTHWLYAFYSGCVYSYSIVSRLFSRFWGILLCAKSCRRDSCVICKCVCVG